VSVNLGAFYTYSSCPAFGEKRIQIPAQYGGGDQDNDKELSQSFECSTSFSAFAYTGNVER
ncbi:MAG: hypothetical protein JXR78_10975, partial [Victivallales bacterium]|nr:hypothetical protein [Victivallales bacterium]